MKKLLLLLLCVPLISLAQQTNRFWENAVWESLVMVGVMFIVLFVIRISEMFGKLTPNTNLKLKSRNEGKTMVWVKCNHCGKNTRKNHPLFIGKCTICAKELDKNLTEIKEQYQDEDTRIENIERMSATKKFDEDVKKHKRMIRIVSSILMIFFAVFWSIVPNWSILIVPGFILLYLNIGFEKKSEKKRKDIINRYYSEKKPKNN